PATWRNTQRLLLPPSAGGRRGGRGTPGLLLLIEGGTCVKALRPRGPPPPAAHLPSSGSWSLGRPRRAPRPPCAAAIEDDTLDRVVDQLDAQAQTTEDIVAQGLHVARALKAEVGKGLHVDPDILARAPVPSYGALQKTMDALLPDGRSASLMVFDGN